MYKLSILSRILSTAQVLNITEELCKSIRYKEQPVGSCTTLSRHIKTHFLPLLGSLIEKVLNGEQKFSSEEAKGCGKISERKGEGTNPALTGSVPNKEAEKGTAGAMLPAGIGPLAPGVCWEKKK